MPADSAVEPVLEQSADEGEAYFGERHGWLPTRLVGHGVLSEAPEGGSLIVRELDTTILVPPDSSISRDRGARLVMVRA